MKYSKIRMLIPSAFMGLMMAACNAAPAEQEDELACSGDACEVDSDAETEVVEVAPE